MRFLFLFLDGVGLDLASPERNPFAKARMPHLQALLGGKQLTLEALTGESLPPERIVPGQQPTCSTHKPVESDRATLLALDATLGVQGLPQSATGQATLLTGVNIPARLGYHYGPKPNPAVAEYLRNGNLFNVLKKSGQRTTLLNAYPPRYFSAIASGHRLYSAIPLAASSAGVALKTTADLYAGKALSADFTSQGWREHLGFPDIPLLDPFQAGERLAELAQDHHFTFFEYWLSDYAGHKQDHLAACSLLESFDQVLAGLLARWDDSQGLILITSDHGNVEDLSTRRHTLNPVPALVIGDRRLRKAFTASLDDLSGISPAILSLFSLSSNLPSQAE